MDKDGNQIAITEIVKDVGVDENGLLNAADLLAAFSDHFDEVTAQELLEAWTENLESE